MALNGFSRNEFELKLTAVLSPSTPIRSPEMLRGREKKLEDIRRSLVQPGRHIFIYGDRGVGKTSLAQTAAYEHHPANGDPIFLGCDGSSTFYRLAHDLAARLSRSDPTISKQTSQKKVGGNWSGASAERSQSTERGQIPDMRSMNEAVQFIAHAAQQHLKAPVVVIDEFERVTDSQERSLFADFIKQAGDQSLHLKMIFCGVGAALDDLLDTHHSCYRYLTAVQLDQLGFRPRFEIIDGASAALDVEIENTTRYRIAMISDGFPHYIHLITEKLLWEAYGDQSLVTSTTPNQYVNSIRAAVLDIEPKLKALYEKATHKYSDEYEPVVWAMADHYLLKRRSSDIFESYRRLTSNANIDSLPRDKFNARMNALKKPAHGSILKATRQGWYEFTEAVVRGYVRLRAEERGISIGVEHPQEVRLRNG